MTADAAQLLPQGPGANPMGPDGLDSSRILIIDDKQSIHDDFRKILASPQESGFEMAGAELFGREAELNDQASFDLDSAFQGQEGLALVQRAVEEGRPYALAFVDIRMPPGCDGIETTSRLWKVDPDLQIVICTAYSDHSWQAIIKRLGNRDSLVILKKPFDAIEILQLANALTKKWLLTGQSKLRFTELEARVAERTIELRAANQKLLQEVIESKRIQEQMHLQSSALSAAANAIIITDCKGKIEWVNPAFTKLTGYTADEAVGSSPRVLKSGKHPPVFYSNLWATVATGNVWHGEVINKHKNGGLYTQDMTITPVRGTDGKIAHFVAIQQDITEQRQLENRLRQAQKMEAIGTLAGGIAHDFNNILAAISGYSSLLQQDTEGNAAAQEDVGEILKAANRASDLVKQILSFSRQREQKREVIRLDNIIAGAAKFLRASLPASIEIQISLDTNAPAVLADPTQIYQVTLNLATNALHAMEGMPGHLNIKLDPFTPSQQFIQAHPEFSPVQYARLTVADTGHGMDADTLKRIFEPFFTTKPVGKGTGLGLSVVHGIVQSHEGIITVESQLGHGATFFIYLRGQIESGKVTAVGPGQLPRGQGQKILLVDDEPALTSAFQRQLQSLNYQVLTSNNARKAIVQFHENPSQFDLVITDLTMPEMNGLELARQLRAIRQDLPVILASGYAHDVNRETLETAGICQLLEKPISMPALAAAVQRALAAKKRQQ
jgi:PAS domain S-box-containing protein